MNAEAARIERCLTDLLESPIANRCVVCGHVKHNDLGYCQTGQCPCSSGVTVGSIAVIIRRDLPAMLDAYQATALEVARAAE